MAGIEPRRGILDIAPYEGGLAAAEGVERVVKLSSNESVLGPSPRAVAAYADAVRDLNRYPDGGATALRAAIAAHHGLDPDRIVCANGSDEIFSLLCQAYAGPGDEVLFSEHSFLLFKITALASGATPVWAPELDLAPDIDALLGRVTPRTRLLFLANPDNPTGAYLSGGALRRLREGLPEDVLLVLDGAYAEFATADDFDPGAGLAGEFGNVVMTRTFSKIYGLAGLRVGWGYCPAPVADVLHRVRMPFNVSLPAQRAATAALEDTAFTARARDHVAQWRDWLRTGLLELGLDAPPSEGNFLFIGFPGGAEEAAAADAYLTERGYLLRRLDAYGFPDRLRLTIGLEADNREVARHLADFRSRGT